jgi:N-acetylglutamate synthase-like GNAT family acetyltransferase
MDVSIRNATIADVAKLTDLARAAKRHWGYPERWLVAWRDTLTITEGAVERMRVFIAEVDGGVVGFCALDQSGNEISLEHLWIAPERMGRGVGSRLFAHAVEAASATGAERLRIESDPNAEGFYLRMGARRIGSVPAPMPDAPDRQLPVLEVRLPAASGGQ